MLHPWSFSRGLIRERIASDFPPRSTSRIKSLQNKRWHALVDTITRVSPHYRGLASKMAHPQDKYQLEAWPILTKSQLIADFDAIRHQDTPTYQQLSAFVASDRNPTHLLNGRHFVLHSSGSSGQPLVVPYTPEEWVHACGLFMRLFKPRFGDKIAFLGASDGHYAGVSLASTYATGIGRFWSRFAAFDFNTPRHQVFKALEAYQPDVIFGYAKALHSLAQAHQAREVTLTVRKIFSNGEMLSPQDAAFCTDHLTPHVGEFYAATEHLFLGGRSHVQRPWTFFDDAFVFERSPSHTLITNLHRTSLPLLRYEMDDILPASTGQLIGRMEHALWLQTDDGTRDYIHPIVLAELYIPGVHRFQFRKESDLNVTFLVELQSADASGHETILRAAKKELTQVLANKGMSRVGVKIEKRDRIVPDSHSGKHRLVVDPDLAVGKFLV